jgi:hypothetical protein
LRLLPGNLFIRAQGVDLICLPAENDQGNYGHVGGVCATPPHLLLIESANRMSHKAQVRCPEYEKTSLRSRVEEKIVPTFILQA